MDKIFDLLPIIVGILFFVIRMFSKSSKSAQNLPKTPEAETTKGSFDDIFKQFQEKIEQAQNTTSTPAKVPQLKSSKQTAQKEIVEKGISESQRKEDQHFKPYQQVSKVKKDKHVKKSTDVFVPAKEKYEKVGKETRMKDAVREEVFSHYAIKTPKKKPTYSSALKNKNSFKQAFILNEIMHPKYSE